MRFLVLLLWVMSFSVQVLAGSLDAVQQHGSTQTLQENRRISADVQQQTGQTGDMPQWQNNVEDLQGFVVQGDLDEAPVPSIATTYHMTQLAFVRPLMLSFTFYVVPVDVFRPPRAG